MPVAARPRSFISPPCSEAGRSRLSTIRCSQCSPSAATSCLSKLQSLSVTRARFELASHALPAPRTFITATAQTTAVTTVSTEHSQTVLVLYLTYELFPPKGPCCMRPLSPRSPGTDPLDDSLPFICSARCRDGRVLDRRTLRLPCFPPFSPFSPFPLASTPCPLGGTLVPSQRVRCPFLDCLKLGNATAGPLRRLR